MMARIMQNINALCERIFLNGKHSLRRVPRIFRLGFPFKVFKSVMVGVLQVSLPRAEVLYRLCSLYLPFFTHYHSVRCTRSCCPLTGLTWKVKMTLWRSLENCHEMLGVGARGLVIFNYLRPFAQVKAVVFMLSSLQNRTHDHMKCNVAISQRASVASGQ